MLHNRTWVLVANGARARIFDFLKGSLIELTGFSHPETRMHGHMTGPRILPTKNEIQHFAQEVSRYLDLEHKANQFQQLHVVASPAFLGLIRHHLHAETRKAIAITVDKNLVGEGARHIRSYLP